MTACSLFLTPSPLVVKPFQQLNLAGVVQIVCGGTDDELQIRHRAPPHGTMELLRRERADCVVEKMMHAVQQRHIILPELCVGRISAPQTQSSSTNSDGKLAGTTTPPSSSLRRMPFVLEASASDLTPGDNISENRMLASSELRRFRHCDRSRMDSAR